MPRAAKASASASIASSQQSQSQSPPYPSAGSSTGAGTATDEANLPSDPKARRRERNRLAASAFRTRKKERLGELEVRLAELEEENRLLKDQVDELRATVRELGGIVLGEEDGEGDGGWAAAAGEYGSISGVKREREDEEDDGHGLIRSIEEKDEEGADADRTLVHSPNYKLEADPNDLIDPSLLPPLPPPPPATHTSTVPDAFPFPTLPPLPTESTTSPPASKKQKLTSKSPVLGTETTAASSSSAIPPPPSAPPLAPTRPPATTNSSSSSSSSSTKNTGASTIGKQPAPSNNVRRPTIPLHLRRNPTSSSLLRTSTLPSSNSNSAASADENSLSPDTPVVGLAGDENAVGPGAAGDGGGKTPGGTLINNVSSFPFPSSPRLTLPPLPNFNHLLSHQYHHRSPSNTSANNASNPSLTTAPGISPLSAHASYPPPTSFNLNPSSHLANHASYNPLSFTPTSTGAGSFPLFSPSRYSPFPFPSANWASHNQHAGFGFGAGSGGSIGMSVGMSMSNLRDTPSPGVLAGGGGAGGGFNWGHHGGGGRESPGVGRG